MKKYTSPLMLFSAILMIFFTLSYFHVERVRHLEEELMDSHNKRIRTLDSLNVLVDSLYKTMESLPLGSPVKDSIIVSSDYGWRKKPKSYGWGFHPGIDIHATWWDTIYTTGSGVVKKASWIGGYGRCIIIEHSGGYESTYAHLYRMFVKVGDVVKKGEPLGRAGNSGFVTGQHLHYEIRRNGEKTDPYPYISLKY